MLNSVSDVFQFLLSIVCFNITCFCPNFPDFDKRMTSFPYDDYSICFRDVSEALLSVTPFLHDGTLPSDDIIRSVESSVSVLHPISTNSNSTLRSKNQPKPTNYFLFGQHLFESIKLKMFIIWDWQSFEILQQFK